MIRGFPLDSTPYLNAYCYGLPNNVFINALLSQRRANNVSPVLAFIWEGLRILRSTRQPVKTANGVPGGPPESGDSYEPLVSTEAGNTIMIGITDQSRYANVSHIFFL